MTITTDTHVLYRFYSAIGQLLYVGITMSPPERFRNHRDRKEWWHEVTGITVENYSSRDDLAAAERRAIQVERPAYNKIHNGPIKLTGSPQPTHAIRTSSTLQYKCNSCTKTVAGGKGYVHVSYDEIYRHEHAWNAWQHMKREQNGNDEPSGGFSAYRIIPASELPDIHPASWRVHHKVCDPKPDDNDYWIDVARVDSHEKLLSWTAHLLEKRWIQDTNWSEFIYSNLSERAKTA